VSGALAALRGGGVTVGGGRVACRHQVDLEAVGRQKLACVRRSDELTAALGAGAGDPRPPPAEVGVAHHGGGWGWVVKLAWWATLESWGDVSGQLSALVSEFVGGVGRTRRRAGVPGRCCCGGRGRGGWGSYALVTADLTHLTKASSAPGVLMLVVVVRRDLTLVTLGCLLITQVLVVGGDGRLAADPAARRVRVRLPRAARHGTATAGGGALMGL
jgi:hypothetical protein